MKSSIVLVVVAAAFGLIPPAAAQIVSITLNPSQVIGGDGTLISATITLNSPATFPEDIGLITSPPNGVCGCSFVPMGTVHFNTGDITATGVVGWSGLVDFAFTETLTAGNNGGHATLTTLPQTWTNQPNTTILSGGSVSGTVTFSPGINYPGNGAFFILAVGVNDSQGRGLGGWSVGGGSPGSPPSLYTVSFTPPVGMTSGTISTSVNIENIPQTAFASIPVTIVGDSALDLGSKDCEGLCGKPIDLTNGNTWIKQRDYSLPGLGGGLSLVRTWNSLWLNDSVMQTAGMFGNSWDSTYEERLQFISSTEIRYWQADGNAWRFVNNGGWVLTTPADITAALAFNASNNEYTVTLANGATRTFNNNGYLIAMADRNGNTVSLAYDSSNRVTGATDAAGRTLTFNYANSSFPNQVSSIQDSTGTIASYTYNSGSLLATVTYSDGSFETFNYGANALITSVTDTNGKVLESHTYDAARRGLSSARANGVEQVTVSYPSDGTTQLTDSLGNTTTYTSVWAGTSGPNGSNAYQRHYMTGVSGPGCSSCGGSGTYSFVVDPNTGRRTSSTDPLGHTTSYTYDSNGNLASTSITVGGAGVVYSYTYNNFAELLTATDPLGNVTTNTYDAKGNLLTTTTPAPGGKTAASKTTFAYDAKGELTQITDPLGHNTNVTYTAVGLVNTITDALKNVTTYAYDAHGNRTSVTDALKNQTAFQYDALNRLTKITRPDQSTIGYAYDTRGRRISVTDENNKITQYAYDDADRLISVTDPANNLTKYSYDSENNLSGITDALKNNTGFSYDALRRLTQTTFPSTKVETYAYDAASNLTSKTDRKGQIISYSYDELGRLTKKQYPDNTTVSYTYDVGSRLTQIQDATGTYGFTYDNMGRLTQASTTYAFLPNTTFNVSYSYDAASNRTGLTDPNRGSISYAYDSINRLSQISDFNRNTFGFSYDSLDRVTQLTRPNKVNSNYQYDTVSNLLSVLHQNGTTTLDGTTYTYDSAANRLTANNKLGGLTSNFAYDNLYELTGVTQGTNTTESYSYDAAGNRLSSLGTPGYTYNVSNQLQSAGSTTYTYDANGNTLTKVTSSGTTTYAWDFENRLTSVTPAGGTTVTFKYDPLGRRIEKGSSIYIYDGANLMQESDSSGNLVARYIQGLAVDQPLAAYRGKTSEFYEADGLGSITSLSTTAGAVNQSYVFESFGNTSSTIGTFTQPFRFTGREFDSETGLYYHRARYYDSSVGRFLTEDPLHYRAGVNFYPYVRGNPVNAKDPFGLLEIYIWNYRGSNSAWGHASITLDDGTHISWWPSDDDRDYKLGTDRIPIYTAPAKPGQTIADDIRDEGQLPDEIVHLEGLDEQAIADWWANFQRDRRWKTLSRNCSTVVGLALRAGGADPAHHLIWTPSNVKKYAEQLAGELPGSGFIPTRVEFPEPPVPWHGAPLAH